MQMIYCFFLMTALLAVATKACSQNAPLPRDGMFVSKIHTTTNPNELLAVLEVYVNGVQSTNENAIMKLDEETISIIPNVDDITVLEAPASVEDVTDGYSVDVENWPTVVLYKSGDYYSKSVELRDPFHDNALLPPAADSFSPDFSYFVTENRAYILYKSPSIFDFDTFVYVIVNLINEEDDVDYLVVRDATLRLSTPVLYADTGVVAIAGNSGLCIERVYFSYNVTNLTPVFSEYVWNAPDLLGALSEGKDVAYGLTQQESDGGDYTTPGVAQVIKTSLETGEQIVISFDLSIVQKTPTGTQIRKCFPGHAVVHVQDTGLVRMDNLAIGDMILTTNDRFEPVYSFGHKSPSSSTKHNFLEIVTSYATTPLVISPDHMIATPTAGFVPAFRLQAGDFVRGGVGASDGGANKVQILSIRKVQAHGAFAPFTPSGTLIVNDIVASSFIAVEHTSLNLYGVEFTWQWIGHTFEFPHRVSCYYFGRRCHFETYNGVGMSSWVSDPLKVGQWVLTQKHTLRNMLLVLFVVLLFIFSVMETVFLYPLATALSVTAVILNFHYRNHRTRIKVKTM